MRTDPVSPVSVNSSMVELHREQEDPLSHVEVSAGEKLWELVTPLCSMVDRRVSARCDVCVVPVEIDAKLRRSSSSC